MISSINEFQKLFPNMVNFRDFIKIKSLENWNCEYVSLTKEVGYWIADSPFYEIGRAHV